MLGAAAAAAAAGDGELARLDAAALADARLAFAAEENVPGFAAGVISCGGGRFELSGLLRFDDRAPVTAAARFNLGSNAKSMLASAAARLAERGELGLDDPLARLWPEAVKVSASEAAASEAAASVAAASETAGDKAELTLSQLLSHRSGLPAFTSGAELRSVPAFEGTPDEIRRQAALWFLEQPLEHEPGTATLYSNAGYVVAGAALSAVSGLGLEALLEREVFAPLELDAVLGTPRTSLDAVGHFVEGDGESSTLRSNLDPDPPVPTFLEAAGNVAISAGDYATYLKAHLCALQGVETGYLTVETVRRLHGSSPAAAPALGWGTTDIAGLRTSFHVGGTGDFMAYAALAPAADFGALLLLNVGGEPAAPGSTWLVAAVTARAEARAARAEAEVN